jgi:hypothetical protein
MPLLTTGLVCRYYFDEAASGTTPTSVLDASGNSYHLTEVNYGSGNMAYTEVSGDRGLDCSATTGAQRARRSINNTSDALRDALAGAQKATIEIVFAPDAFAAGGARIFGVNGRSGQNGEFVLKATSLTEYDFAFNDANLVTKFNPGISAATRTVLHIVVDSTDGTTANRVRYSVNGGTLTAVNDIISLNETLALGSDLDLIAFNRESTGSFDRSMDGVLYYAALYAHALTQQECTDNYDILVLDDDTPGGAAGLGIPIVMHHRRMLSS